MIRAFLVTMLLACSGSPGGPNMHNSVTGPEATPQSSSVVSGDILAREAQANHTSVKHILIGWKKDGEDHIDPRAAKRTKKDAEDQIRSLLTQLKAGGDFDQLAKQWSEDPGSTSGHIYAVSPDAQLVIEFRQLGLRLKVGEVGVVESDFGFHIMTRVD